MIDGLRRNNVTTVIGVLLVITFFFNSVTLLVQADEPTTIQATPPSLTVTAGEIFSLNIHCVPSRPIKSFELKISFNPSLVQANSVSEGDIFNGYTTFFNSGNINNNAGLIINIYDLIIGPENVTSPGTLVTISFTAKTLSGTSSIHLYEVGVTDEIGYLPISISDGSVTVHGENQPPQLSGVSPSNTSTAVPVSTSSLSLTIRDPEGNLFNWSITTSPNIGSASGKNASNGSKSCSISGLSYSTTYHWYVSCKDRGSNHWTNASYWFTTAGETQGGNPGGGGGGNPGGGGEEQPSEPNQNHPPNTPVKPIGPTFIERGIEYEYTSSASDPEGDQVRLRFDWGDGSFSNWSVFADSNTTVSSSHLWSNRSTFTVRVIAQDENRSNSSWSLPLNVTVSEPQSNEESPVIDIIAPDNGSANQTIVFDASVNIGSGEAIISYTWDFGDGTTETGKNPSHTYTKPGVYSVTLTVTDNTGQTYIKTFVIAIEAGAEIQAQNQEFPFLYLGIVLILILGMLSISLLIIFRKKLQNIFSNRLMEHQQRKITQLSTKISSLNQNVSYKPVKKKYVTKDNKFSKSIDSSLEDEVDRVLLSKIEEKIDKM